MKKTYLAVTALTGLFAVAASLAAADEAAKIVAEQNLPNQLKNGTFKIITGKGVAPDWSLWKREDSTGMVTFEPQRGNVKSYEAVFSGGSCSLYSWVKINGGEKIYVRAKVKRKGNGEASLSLRFHDAQRKWLRFTCHKSIAFSETDEWIDVELVAKAPTDAKTAIPMLSAKNLEGAESKIVFDDVELYILPETEK